MASVHGHSDIDHALPLDLGCILNTKHTNHTLPDYALKSEFKLISYLATILDHFLLMPLAHTNL